MDPISSGSNPTNNPRLDLLNNTGGNQQLNGAAGSYGPNGGGPQSASAYVQAAQAGRPDPVPPQPTPTPVPPPAAAPIPQPRPVEPSPLYTSVPSGGDDGGGISGGILAIVGVVILFLLGGMYLVFHSQVSNQNKQIQAALQKLQDGGGNGTEFGDIKTHTIDNAEKVTTKTLEVTQGVDDENGIASLIVNGSSQFQGPVSFGSDVNVNGTVTATKFIGDGSGLSGVQGAAGPTGARGSSGARGATGATGGLNPNAQHSQTADTATNCTTCLTLQTGTLSPQTGSAQITGAYSTTTGNFLVSSLAAGQTRGLYIQDSSGTDLGGLDQAGTSHLLSLQNLTSDGSIAFSTATGSTGDIYFTTSGSDSLHILANGNVGVGTATPGSYKLNVNGDTHVTGVISTTGAASVGGNVDTAGAFQTGGTTRIAANGDATLGAITGSSLGLGGGTITAKTLSSGDGTNTISGSIDVGGNIQTAGTTRIATDGTATLSTTTIGGLQLSNSSGALLSTADFTSSGKLSATGDITTLSGTLKLGLAGITLSNSAGTLLVSSGISTTSTVTAVGGFSAGFGNTGIDRNCAGGETLNDISVVGGIVTAGTCTTNGSDYAELYPSTQSLSAGEVVAIDPSNPEGVIRTTYAGQSTAIGIVSTQPGKTIGVGNTVVALSGRVPVKVSDENGAVQAGDYLTSSSTPGVAMKAGSGQKTIGQAMTSASGGTVIAFVSVSNGGMTEVQQAQSSVGQGGSDFTDLNASGTATIATLNVTGAATVASLKVTGTAEVATLKVNGHIIGNSDTRGTATVAAGTTSVRHDFTSNYTAKPVVVASPVNASADYHVTSDTAGFTITVDTPATTDLQFNYLVQQ